MYKAILIFFLFLSSFQSNSQALTGAELLEKGIAYHDPNGNWNTFNGELFITMETPKGANRDSHLKINLPKEYFYIKNTRANDTISTEFTVEKDSCSIAFCGSATFSPEVAKKNRLTCKSAKFYRNYYTYLFGLPMKLKDAGTKISEEVERKKFQGKEYLVLKATYDKEKGKEVWCFYFNPKNYALEVYQFFRADDAGNLNLKSGEYIVLTDTKTINGIKIPKTRAWYFNKDNTYLGTDILK